MAAAPIHREVPSPVGGGGSSQQKKTELRMLGEEGLMVPCELLGPAHPQAGNLWHLNYVSRQSTVPVLPKQAVLRFSLLVETPIYSRFFCHPVFRSDKCDFLGWELVNGFPRTASLSPELVRGADLPSAC